MIHFGLKEGKKETNNSKMTSQKKQNGSQNVIKNDPESTPKLITKNEVKSCHF